MKNLNLNIDYNSSELENISRSLLNLKNEKNLERINYVSNFKYKQIFIFGV